jgi:hypothetical protein
MTIEKLKINSKAKIKHGPVSKLKPITTAMNSE